MKVSHTSTVKIGDALTLYNALCMSCFKFNLISVRKLTKDLKCHLLFSLWSSIIQNLLTSKTIGVGRLEDGLYQIKLDNDTSSCKNLSSALHFTLNTKNNFDVWHYRIERNSLSVSEFIPGTSKNKECGSCYICLLAEMCKGMFSISQYKSNLFLELIHCDIWNTCNETSYDGYRCFLSFLDYYSQCVWIYLLNSKSETGHTLQSFCALVETQFKTKIKIIWSDNGRELEMKDFYKKKWIIHQRTWVETAEQNGRMERKHQQILNVAKVFRFQSGV